MALCSSDQGKVTWPQSMKVTAAKEKQCSGPTPPTVLFVYLLVYASWFVWYPVTTVQERISRISTPHTVQKEMVHANIQRIYSIKQILCKYTVDGRC